MIIVGIDTETTGYVPEAEVVEFGYCVYGTHFGDGGAVLATGSDLFVVNEWSSEAEAHHGITETMTEVAGIRTPSIDYMARIAPYKPELIVAHNAEHDYVKVKRYWPELCELPWLCTYKDLDHSKFIRDIQSRKLMHLAIEYGLPVIGWHRALGDAEYAAKIAAKHDLEEALERRNQPHYTIHTGGSYRHDVKDTLKEVGFLWSGDNKKWFINNVVESDVPTIKSIISKLAPDWVIEIKEDIKTY